MSQNAPALGADAERIAVLERENIMLRQVLIEQWGVFSECYVMRHDEALHRKAFHAFDRRLRKLGILPPVSYMAEEARL